jgi:bcr-type benzoyl-CoA reductase subunit C
MSVLERLTEGVNLPNPWIDGWREDGKKVLGYFCTYIPEEIIYAGNLLPVRIRAGGCVDTPTGDAYMSSTTCSFTRCVMELASRDEYQFLDGVVAYNSCDQVRRLYDNVRFKAPFPYQYFLSVPGTSNDTTLEWYKHELSKFKLNLEEEFGLSIAADDLNNATNAYNESRDLLGQLYELRKQEAPPITGTEVMNVILASMSLPREEFNKLLGSLLDEVRDKEGQTQHTARIMVIGSHLDDPKFVELIEGLGGLVVADSLCFGSRYFSGMVQQNSDPLEALAEGYFSKVPCPRMTGAHPERAKFIKDQIEEFKVDGVILQRMKFCPIWWGENFMLMDDLKEIAVPYLELEKEYVLSGVGAIKTRIQAFLETLEGR